MRIDRRNGATDEAGAAGAVPGAVHDGRLPYEPPRIIKRHEVRRVTLFSGGGVVAVGLTASG